ncbi:DUF6147 family protein [Blautia luti]|uniref:DUF6147 family protein n=1 Tax=Blautia luti TaxID=89014 RepID=UPI001D002519|nr:DUF6147 family protein [Blautia luti]MCB5473241.1 DUF6147 family protein [Blautia luti]
MKRKLRKIIGILLMVAVLGTISITPVAAANILEDTSTETELDYSEDTAYSVLRGNNLNFGTTSIEKLASNKVGISAITQCHHSCNKVYLEVYLERKVNGSYATYKSWSFTANNATKLVKDITVIVPRGYYYRVRGYHAAKDGSKESVITLTKGVLVK